MCGASEALAELLLRDVQWNSKSLQTSAKELAARQAETVSWLSTEREQENCLQQDLWTSSAIATWHLSSSVLSDPRQNLWGDWGKRTWIPQQIWSQKWKYSHLVVENILLLPSVHLLVSGLSQFGLFVCKKTKTKPKQTTHTHTQNPQKTKTPNQPNKKPPTNYQPPKKPPKQSGHWQPKKQKDKKPSSSDITQSLNTSEQVLSTLLLLQLQSNIVLNNCLGNNSVSQRCTTESGILLLLRSHVSNMSAPVLVWCLFRLHFVSQSLHSTLYVAQLPLIH